MMEAPTPQDQAFQAIIGFWASQTLVAAAKLGIADHVGDSPRTAGQVAESLGSDPFATARFLRALSMLGVATVDRGRYSLTPFGQSLRKDAPGSTRSLFLGVLAEDHRRAWTALDHSVKTGETAFDHVFAMPAFEYYGRHPEVAADFNDAMTAGSAAVEPALLEAFDFAPYGRIVDVGGGNGGLLAAALNAAPRAEGILYDLPAGLAGSKDLLKKRGVAGRCEVVGGDFFEAVPAGGDLYLLKWILHDWDDRRAEAILRNVRKAAGPGTRLLVVDVVLPDGEQPSPGHLADLNMMVMCGGRERTGEEFRRMLEFAGFSDVRVKPTRSMFGIVEAEVAG